VAESLELLGYRSGANPSRPHHLPTHRTYETYVNSLLFIDFQWLTVWVFFNPFLPETFSKHPMTSGLLVRHNLLTLAQ